MSPSPDPLALEESASFDPPEVHDDAPIAPFDPRNEEHDLCLCEENHDA